MPFIYMRTCSSKNYLIEFIDQIPGYILSTMCSYAAIMVDIATYRDQ